MDSNCNHNPAVKIDLNLRSLQHRSKTKRQKDQVALAVITLDFGLPSLNKKKKRQHIWLKYGNSNYKTLQDYVSKRK